MRESNVVLPISFLVRRQSGQGILLREFFSIARYANGQRKKKNVSIEHFVSIVIARLMLCFRPIRKHRAQFSWHCRPRKNAEAGIVFCVTRSDK
ncbi:hypothetical protein CEXT_560071 [Caerostris extrusa]|uniref:Uncharacterized protein n=1 Tax=Caerostris extrusa TaxID=172846 RepID=A0AAV4XNR8_CAEEX|nr:hypothetical protein CEXT_560071 [Caerostris extrusa]